MSSGQMYKSVNKTVNYQFVNFCIVIIYIHVIFSPKKIYNVGTWKYACINFLHILTSMIKKRCLVDYDKNIISIIILNK